jgi:hypothetical protein
VGFQDAQASVQQHTYLLAEGRNIRRFYGIVVAQGCQECTSLVLASGTFQLFGGFCDGFTRRAEGA